MKLGHVIESVTHKLGDRTIFFEKKNSQGHFVFHFFSVDAFVDLR